MNGSVRFNELIAKGGNHTFAEGLTVFWQHGGPCPFNHLVVIKATDGERDNPLAGFNPRHQVPESHAPPTGGFINHRRFISLGWCRLSPVGGVKFISPLAKPGHARESFPEYPVRLEGFSPSEESSKNSIPFRSPGGKGLPGLSIPHNRLCCDTFPFYLCLVASLLSNVRIEGVNFSRNSRTAGSSPFPCSCSEFRRMLNNAGNFGLHPALPQCFDVAVEKCVYQFLRGNVGHALEKG